MAVEPEVSEQIDTFQGVPVVNRRSSKTEVVVANGESFVMGGLMKVLKRTEERKVPLLGDIPLLGFLFRSTRDKMEKIELLFLFTPQIFEDDQEAAELARRQIETIEKSRKN